MNWWVIKRRVHVSYSIVFTSSGVLIGAAMTNWIDPSWLSALPWLLIGTTIILLACFRPTVWLVGLACLGGIVVGGWRSSILAHETSVYKPYYSQTVTVTGTLLHDPKVGKAPDEFRLTLDNVQLNGQAVGGSVWASVKTNKEPKRGDSLTLKGKLSPGFGSFAASLYRSQLIALQRPYPGDVARRLRDGFASSVRHSIAEPAASLGLGYLVGQRRYLSPELDQNLRLVGLVHIVVASGFHLSILVRLTRRLFTRLSRYSALAATFGTIFGFMAITGSSPSMTRASLISGLSLLAWYYGRQFHPLVLLIVAAAITVLIEPSYIHGDLGWLLSFTAFGGVMIVAPLLQAYFFGNKKPGTVRQILGETIAAQIVTLPILIIGFGYFSNVALISNISIVPFVGLAMALTALTGVVTLGVPLIGSLVGQATGWLLEGMIAIVNYLADLPWVVTELEVGLMWAVPAYAILIAGCYYMHRKTRFNLAETNIVE